MDTRYIIQFRDVATAVWERAEPNVFFADVVEALEFRDRYNAGLRRDGFGSPARVVTTAGKIVEYGVETVHRPSGELDHVVPRVAPGWHEVDQTNWEA